MIILCRSYFIKLIFLYFKVSKNKMYLINNKCINFGEIFLPQSPKGAVNSEVDFMMDGS